MHAKKLDKIATAVLYSIAGIIVAILASLILYILVRGLPHISWSFLTGKSSSYQAGGGIGIQLYNSFFLLVITLIISVPLSMGAGIFLAEYAKKGPVTNFVRTCIEILSSGFERIPQVTKELTPEEQADVEKLLEKIEEDEDVQNVYHTMKESEE